MPFQKGHAGFPRRTALAEVEIIDEYEPPPIRRFIAEIAEDWLISRLTDVWGKRDWRARLADLSRSNDVLLITNGDAVLCVARSPHLMSGIPDVKEVFGFSRYARLAQDGSGNWTIPDPVAVKGLVDLYRRAREWKIEMGGGGMIAGVCSDLTVSDIKRYNWKGTKHVLEIR